MSGVSGLVSLLHLKVVEPSFFFFTRIRFLLAVNVDLSFKHLNITWVVFFLQDLYYLNFFYFHKF